MFKTIFMASALLISSAAAYAVDQTPKTYDINVKDALGKVSFSVSGPLGQIVPIVISKKEKGEDSKCKIELKNDHEISTLETVQKVASTDITSTIYPISRSGDDVEVLLVYNYVEPVSFESSDKVTTLGEHCKLSNSVAVTTNTMVQWTGKIKLGTSEKINMSNGNALFVEVKEAESKFK
jgi:hypothetical protein